MNSLVHASRLGLKVGFCSRVGADAFGPWLRDGWAAEGIDLSHAPLVPGENGIYFITNDASGERSFSYRRARSAASQMDRTDLDEAWLRAGRFVLLSGITQAISPSAAALTEAAAQALGPAEGAAESGGGAVFDPNHRPALWESRGGQAAARAAFAAVAPHAAWLMPSYPDDTVLLGAPVASAQDALAGFVSAGRGQVAMKMGGEGVLLAGPQGVTHVRGQEVTSIVDTTGAGDAWNAAFLAGLLRGKAPVEAAAAANAHAAGVLAYPGAVPAREES
ncbi:MAG: sugar kinase [Pseudomonadota bacterium]